MCPDPSLISAFVDDEVPSPWKERLAAHVAACPACEKRVRGYAGLRQVLVALPAGGAGEDEAAILARIENRLGARLGQRLEAPSSLPKAETPVRAAKTSPLWHRSLRLPLPLAAAAAALMVFLAGLAAAGYIRPIRPVVQSLAAAQIAPTAAQPASMEALIHYLETQDAKVNLTIELPSGDTLSSSGKPLVVRAADANYLPPSGLDGK